MTQGERRLGKGLDGLIGAPRPERVAPTVAGAPTPPPERGVAKIPLDKVDPNPWQPRRDFPEAELEDLIRSIQRHGVIQPILVRKFGERYQIVAGERRWRASQEVGTGTIAALITDATDRDMLEWSIIENAQRQDLNPIETAAAFRRLIDEFRLTQEEVAERVGQSRSHVANTMRLLDLPDDIQGMVSRGTVSAGAARALLAIKSPNDRLRLAREIADGRMTVRQVEAAAARSPAVKARRPGHVDANLAEVSDELQVALAMRVRISGTPKRGAVTISYHSPQELARIHALLTAGAQREAEIEDKASSITV